MIINDYIIIKYVNVIMYLYIQTHINTDTHVHMMKMNFTPNEEKQLNTKLDKTM